MQTIRIPEPCHEDWNKMTPAEKGRHCNSCCKTVVDFTDWELPDIVQYLHRHQHTCGRFQKEQLNQPVPEPDIFISAIRYAPLSFSARVAALIVFVFAVMTTSCNTREAGQSAMATTHTAPDDTSRMLMGDTITVPANDTAEQPGCNKAAGAVVPDPPEILMGEPVAMPEPTMGIPEIAQPPDEIVPAPSDSL